MKAIYVHLKNKFVGHLVTMSQSGINVHDRETGELLCSALKDAHGSIICGGEREGAKYKLCMSPIPKAARFYKLEKEGVEFSEVIERIEYAKKLVKEYGYVPCMKELEELEKNSTKK